MPDRREHDVYPHAAAVFTQPVKFVELSAMRVETPEAPKRRPGRGGRASPQLPWRPFVRVDPRKKKGSDPAEQFSFDPISYPRWIYVFRRDATKLEAPDWVEELRIEIDPGDDAYDLHIGAGEAPPTPSKNPYTIAAVPMAPVGAKDSPGRPTLAKAASRPAPKQLTKNPRFARRVRGRPQEYFFFGTRVRLEPEALDRLQTSVADWALPIVFDGKAPYVGVDAKTGELIVPIFDPLSIAVGIHQRFLNAIDAVIRYHVPSSARDAKEKTAIEQRLTKVVLAQVLDRIIKGSPDSEAVEQIVNGFDPQRGGKDAVEMFLDQYQHQVDYRAKWSRIWGRWLGNWLRAAPMREFLPSIHLHDVVGNPALAAEFLVPYCYCVSGMLTVDSSRDYLAWVIENPNESPWVSRWVMPDQPLSSNEIQALRKAESAAAVAIMEFGPMAARGLEIGAARKKLMGRLKSRWPKVALDEAIHVVHDDLGVIGVTLEHEGVTAERIALRSDAEMKANWHGAPTKLLVVVEALNLYLSARAVKDSLSSAKGKWDKVLIGAGLLGSAFDLASAYYLAIGKDTPKTRAIAFASAVFDVVIASDDLVKAYREHDTGRVVGDKLLIVGYAMGGVAALGVVELPVIGAAALLLVASGYILKKAFSKTDPERFGLHCTWGSDHPGSGDADFAAAPFDRWGIWPGGYDIQLRSLFNLLCNFRIAPVVHGPAVEASATFEMGWIPPQAHLEVSYEEEGGEHALDAVTSVVSFDEEGKATSVGMLKFEGDPKKGYRAIRRGGSEAPGDRRKIRYSARLVIPLPETGQRLYVPALDKSPIELVRTFYQGVSMD